VGGETACFDCYVSIAMQHLYASAMRHESQSHGYQDFVRDVGDVVGEIRAKLIGIRAKLIGTKGGGRGSLAAFPRLLSPEACRNQRWLAVFQRLLSPGIAAIIEKISKKRKTNPILFICVCLSQPMYVEHEGD
jgi:hypothetical protein